MGNRRSARRSQHRQSERTTPSHAAPRRDRRAAVQPRVLNQESEDADHHHQDAVGSLRADARRERAGRHRERADLA
ncbi:hypothetical protein BVI1335_3270002 [Burkholderia vietnamiensis]|nr:hypothetical protein BVI1335_3270002 [Burkholderia vietnamiensis]